MPRSSEYADGLVAQALLPVRGLQLPLDWQPARAAHETAKARVPVLLTLCHVEILRIMLCSSCATIAEAEEIYCGVVASRPIRDDLSSQSSICIFAHAQGKRISASRCARFPHFHSDGYYYGLYPYYKTGYSSPSQ